MRSALKGKERLATLEKTTTRQKAAFGYIHILRVEFNTDETPGRFKGDFGGRARTNEWIENQVTFAACQLQAPLNELRWERREMSVRVGPCGNLPNRPQVAVIRPANCSCVIVVVRRFAEEKEILVATCRTVLHTLRLAVWFVPDDVSA